MSDVLQTEEAKADSHPTVYHSGMGRGFALTIFCQMTLGKRSARATS